MEANHNVILLNHFFDRINCIHRFGGDGPQPHRLCEFEQLSRLALVLGHGYHAIVHRFNFVFLQFVLHFLDDLGRGVVVPLHIRLFSAELLAGVKFDHFSAHLSRFFNSLENAEMIERVSLTANEEAASATFIRDFILCMKPRRRRQSRNEHGTETKDLL